VARNVAASTENSDARPLAVTAFQAVGDRGDARGLGQGLHAAGIGLADAGGQHLAGRRLGDDLGGGRQEGVQLGAVDAQDQAGIGAELAGALGQGGDELRRDGRAARLQGVGQEQDRVDAAHLGIERDRLGTALGDGQQGQAGAARAGEASGLDAVVGDQALRDLDAGVVQQGEDAGRQAAGLDGLLDGAADQFRGAGVGRWALTTTGQPAARAEAVSPPATEKASGKFEAPNTATGPSGTLRRRRSGRGQRLAVRLGRVDAGFQPAAVAQHAGEHLQLAHGAAALAFEAGAGQAGLGHGADDQVVADRLDLGGDGFQEHGALLGRGGAVRAEGGRRQGGRLVEVGLGRAAEGDVQRAPVLGSTARIEPPARGGRRRRSEVHR
jgi:hypothetical protein